MISFIIFTIYSIKKYSENQEKNNPSDNEKNNEIKAQRFSSRYFNFTAAVRKESDVNFINK